MLVIDSNTTIVSHGVATPIAYSLPSMPQHLATPLRSTDPAPSKRFVMEDQASGVQMYLEDNNDDACGILYAKEPVEDPTYSCWLNPDSDSMDDYICVHEHPCLDIEDGVEHSEDSY